RRVEIVIDHDARSGRRPRGVALVGHDRDRRCQRIVVVVVVAGVRMRIRLLGYSVRVQLRLLEFRKETEIGSGLPQEADAEVVVLLISRRELLAAGARATRYVRIEAIAVLAHVRYAGSELIGDRHVHGAHDLALVVRADERFDEAVQPVEIGARRVDQDRAAGSRLADECRLRTAQDLNVTDVEKAAGKSHLLALGPAVEENWHADLLARAARRWVADAPDIGLDIRTVLEELQGGYLILQVDDVFDLARREVDAG